jgi:hypothetical protein
VEKKEKKEIKTGFLARIGPHTSFTPSFGVTFPTALLVLIISIKIKGLSQQIIPANVVMNYYY